MKLLRGANKGFTLMELLVVIAILAVLMAVVAPAVSGTKSVSTEGQVKSDAKATQTSVDNFNNKSIRVGAFPEVALSATTHRYVDVYGTNGSTVTLRDKNDATTLGTLASVITKPGTTTTVPTRTVIQFTSTTTIYDADGSVKVANFTPDFLQKEPSSLPLKGDETVALGTSGNTLEEYLWLLLVNAPGAAQESRTVEVFRLTAATGCSVTGGAGTCTAMTYTQIH